MVSTSAGGCVVETFLLCLSLPKVEASRDENRYTLLCPTASLNLQRLSKFIDDCSHCKRLLHKRHLNHSRHFVIDSLTQAPGETFN